MSTYGDYWKVQLTKDTAQDLTIALIVVVFCSMATNLTSPEVAFLVALCILNLAEVLTLNETLSGFANSGLITIGSLFLVIGAIEKSHVVDYASRKCFGMNSSRLMGQIRMYISSFIISAWFNNIPQVAIMIPVVKDWARLRGISPSQLLIPLSYVVLAGGMLATIGTSTNLVVTGLLDQRGLQNFNFFDPAVIGLPAGAVLIVYMIIAAPYLLPHHAEVKSAQHTRAFTNILEIGIKEGSVYVGQTYRDFFSGLGLSIDSFVKVRRYNTNSPIVADIKGTYVEEKNTSDVELATVEKTDQRSVFQKQRSSKYGEQFYVSVAQALQTDETDSSYSSKHLLGPPDGRYKYLPSQMSAKLVRAETKFWDFLPTFFQLQPGFEEIHESYSVNMGVYDDLLPDLDTVIVAGDVLFAADAPQAMVKLMKIMPWENQGVTVLGDVDVMNIPTFGYHLLELTISSANPFINERFEVVADQFAAKYEGVIVSAKALEEFQDNAEAMFHRDSSMQHVLTQGSTILFVTSKESYDRLILTPDFVSVSEIDQLPIPATYWSFFPAMAFMTIVSLVAAEQVDICPASMAMAALFFVFGWLSPKDIESYVDLRLLMLMGTSISFAISMTKTGLASLIAENVAGNVSNPLSALFLIYIATLFITEIISNNAAAALMLPIAISLAEEMDVSYRPFAMVVMHAASMAFMCPIGYPTHIMVWLPGNYSFNDFIKFGFVPNIIWCIVTCLLAPVAWPF